jgi:co-chaperonin GroES (HSP10)
MKPSRYLEKFQKLASVSDAFNLVGDFLIVERIPDEELKTKSGLFIPVVGSNKQLGTLSADRPHWVRVLAVGPGYYTQETNEDGTIVEASVPLDVQAGDIILVSQVSVRWFSVFGELENYEADSIGFTKESEIQLRFHGDEGYNRVFGALNNPAQEEVAGAQ